MAEKVTKTDEEWRRQLTPEQYEVMRRHGTERPWSGEHNETKDDGVFRCAGCGAELFSSEAKYESGSGWPSFFAEIEPGRVALHEDRTRRVCATASTRRR